MPTMLNRESAIIIAIATILISMPITCGIMLQSMQALARPCTEVPCEGGAPLAVSGANVYAAWTTNVTLHNVPAFFTKSNDGGNTFANTIVISAPNKNPKTLVVNQNIKIDVW